MDVPLPLFDDTYSGERWTYGVQYRPITGGGVPQGWIIFSDRPHPDFKFGTVDYPAPLTEHQARQADLVAVLP